MTMSKAFRLIILALLCVNILACQTYQSRYKNPLPANDGKEFFWHTVVHSGETLGIISKWHTGAFDNWKYIRDVNPRLDPHKIAIGDKVRIPGKLMKNSSSMPKDFVSAFYNKKSASDKSDPKPQSKETQSKEKSADVFVEKPVATDVVDQISVENESVAPVPAATSTVDEVVAQPAKTEIDDEQELIPFENEKSVDETKSAVQADRVKEESVSAVGANGPTPKDGSLQKTREDLLKELLSE